MTRTLTAIAFALLLLVTARFIFAGEFPRDWTWDDTEETQKAHDEITGKPMPKLSLAGWINGQVTPEDMKGKILIIDFYATWCGPCIRGIPHNNEMMSKYKDKGVLIFGVCTTDTGQEKMEDVAKANDMKYPSARDPKLESQKAWRVSYYPTFAIVDRKGILRAIGVQPEYVEKVVDKLLEEDAKK